MIRQRYCNTVIAIAGPPHSGKSVFLAELHRQLRKWTNRVFVQRACPDGEGMWSSEADPEIVKAIRRKGQFSEEFMTMTLSGIEQLGQNSEFAIVLLDLGGKRTAENAEILRRSNYLILLSSKPSEVLPWQEFALAEGCETLAVLESRLDLANESGQSELDFSDTPISGVLWNLDRDSVQQAYQGAIEQLAIWLIKRWAM
jgi:CRISPR-associated protein Csx3